MCYYLNVHFQGQRVKRLATKLQADKLCEVRRYGIASNLLTAENRHLHKYISRIATEICKEL